jgi:hypothetical protein
MCQVPQLASNRILLEPKKSEATEYVKKRFVGFHSLRHQSSVPAPLVGREKLKIFSWCPNKKGVQHMNCCGKLLGFCEQKWSCTA